MANQSVLGSPSVRHSGNRTGFSMSQGFTFTAGAGMLLPVYKQFLNIGEKVSGCPKAFARTEPLLAPSMTDLDMYVDVFFVPMRHLISMFDAWLTQVDDVPSNMWHSDDWVVHLPVVGKKIQNYGESEKLEAFGWCDYSFFNNFQYVNSSQVDTPGTTHTGLTFGFGAHRLAMHLGYNAQGFFAFHQKDPAASGRADYATFDYDTFEPNNILADYLVQAKNIHQAPFCPYYHLAYQKIYYDYYRDSNFEANRVHAYNLDDEMNDGIEMFAPTTYGSATTDIFKLRYRNRSKDYFSAVHPSPVYNGIGMIEDSDKHLARVKNWLQGVAPIFDFDSQRINLHDDLDVVLHGDEEVSGSSGRNSVYGSSGTFTQARATYYALSKNLVSSDDDNVVQPLFHTHPINYQGDIEDGALGVYASDFGISLAQMRTAFAMDKLLRISNRAGKHVDDQMFAQFGVKIPQGVSGEVYKIKSYHCPFHIGEVIQSATTVDADGQNVPLGEMAGRGVAILNSDDKFNFTAPCHGILMAILSISPRYKYMFAVEKDGLKAYLEDFFRPQYDNLGMQPLDKYELGLPDDSVTSVWQYRYLEDKIKFDKASYVFATNSKNPWSFVTVPNEPKVSGNLYQGHMWQKVLPWDTNNLFFSQFNGLVIAPRDRAKGSGDYVGSVITHTPVEFLSNYLSDPFTIDFAMSKETLVSQMSTYGEPALGGL